MKVDDRLREVGLCGWCKGSRGRFVLDTDSNTVVWNVCKKCAGTGHFIFND